MTLLRNAVVTLVVAIALAFGLGFLLPDNVHVERSIAIAAPADTVFAEIADLNAWDAWSPWAQIDPNAEMTVSGSGVGQKMVWSSEDARVGHGSQEIIALSSPTDLKTHLIFEEQGAADATFKLTEADNATQVTWMLDTDMREGVPVAMQPFVTYMGFLMDATVGKDYETGLQNLKSTIEEKAIAS
ncbi:MAG: SRPBCC family protein [Cyanobacteria bacterium J06642_2]